MRKILIVEDDRGLSDGITLALKDGENKFYQAFDLHSAREHLKKESITLVILDLNLPDGNGMELLKEIRAGSGTPVLILTANDLETDIVTGLELGADDYITKPFSLMVLRARVNTQLRKLQSGKTDIIQIDPFYFDFDKMLFTKHNVAIELSKTEQKLLKLLVFNRGITLSREDLLERLWPDGAQYVDANALSVTVKRLRDKLEVGDARKYIRTVYGIGYCWVEE